MFFFENSRKFEKPCHTLYNLSENPEHAADFGICFPKIPGDLKQKKTYTIQEHVRKIHEFWKMQGISGKSMKIQEIIRFFGKSGK